MVKKKVWTKQQRINKTKRLAKMFAKEKVAIPFYVDKYGKARRPKH